MLNANTDDQAPRGAIERALP